MIPNDQQKKRIWESWLDEECGNRLTKIREAVRETYKENQAKYGELPYFTPHGPEHCLQVENRIHDIIPDERHTKLTIVEKFYLLAAAWLHDIGMLPIVAESVYRKEWPLDEHEIRRRHHLTSGRYIVDNWATLAIDEVDKGTLGKLCRYHNRLEEISECDPTPLARDKPCRLRLLAAYLRIADSLDIGPWRTPAESYAACLAYDIPAESKLHWIKSRLVSCINPNPDNHKIYVQFKYPEDDQLNKISRKEASKKVDGVIKLVVNDLRDELASVMNVITREEISYYLDVEETKVKEPLDSRMLNDLRELVVNSDIEAAPSASKMLEMVLISVANIIGFSLSEDSDPVPFDTVQPMYPSSDLGKKVSQFLDAVEKEVGITRAHHLGLRRLIKECRKYSQEISNGVEPLELVAKEINERYKEHHRARHAIRKNSEALFSEMRRQAGQEPLTASLNILLYGYSELVTKAICGLRDCLIREVYEHTDPKDIYNDEKERLVSNRIHIFICEGQPKTQTGYRDRLI